MFSSLAVANFFVQRALATGQSLTPMQLVKLVYIAHGWYLARTGRPLIADGVEAWKYGPVIPDVYHAFKHFRDGNITGQAVAYHDGQQVVPLVHDQSTANFLESVWNAYKGFSGVQLSSMTHQNGTPWSDVWRLRGGSLTRGALIPHDLIKAHYEKLARERDGQR